MSADHTQHAQIAVVVLKLCAIRRPIRCTSVNSALDYESPPLDTMPNALRAVAWIYIAVGVTAAVGIVASAIHERVSIDFSVVGSSWDVACFDAVRAGANSRWLQFGLE
jgi:hypothetical protein